MDKLKFAAACAQAVRDIESAPTPAGIGTLSEGAVHRALKLYFEPDVSRHEIEIGGYVADAVGEDGIIEVQTAGFGRMRPKLEAFLSAAAVTLVHPIIAEKTITQINPESGEVISRRKSPKKPDEWGVFRELYPIRDLLSNPRLRLCLCLISADEHRFGRKRRWQTWQEINVDPPRKYPTGLIKEIWLRSPADYAALYLGGIAPDEPEFTTAEFAALSNIPADTARLCLPVLCALGLARRTGKRGSGYLYVRDHLSR